MGLAGGRRCGSGAAWRVSYLRIALAYFASSLVMLLLGGSVARAQVAAGAFAAIDFVYTAVRPDAVKSR